MVMGVLFFGYIIASVAAGMANADTQRAIFADKIRSIKTYMEVRSVYCFVCAQIHVSLNELDET